MSHSAQSLQRAQSTEIHPAYRNVKAASRACRAPIARDHARLFARLVTTQQNGSRDTSTRTQIDLETAAAGLLARVAYVRATGIRQKQAKGEKQHLDVHRYRKRQVRRSNHHNNAWQLEQPHLLETIKQRSMCHEAKRSGRREISKISKSPNPTGRHAKMEFYKELQFQNPLHQQQRRYRNQLKSSRPFNKLHDSLTKTGKLISISVKK